MCSYGNVQLLQIPTLLKTVFSLFKKKTLGFPQMGKSARVWREPLYCIVVAIACTTQ